MKAPAGSALDLAVMRIVVGLLLLGLPEAHEALATASQLPQGFTRYSGPVPVDSTLAHLAWVLYLGGAAFGTIGLWPRLGFALATLGGTYLLWIPQLVGTTIHYHHALWLSAVLAVAPSADALAPGARVPIVRSPAHGLPLRLAWIVLGLVYFFPGLHKLMAAGLSWDPVPHFQYKQILSWGFEPLFDLAAWPGLAAAGGAAVVLFELLFILAVCFERTRPIAAAVALLFHLATAALFDIQFSSLSWCLLLLLPWTRWFGVHTEPSQARPRSIELMLGAVLLVAISVPGLRGQTQGWPFACYPTFSQPPPDHVPGLLIATVRGGVEREIPMTAWAPQESPQRLWSEVWRVSGVVGPVDPEGLERLWRRVAVSEQLLTQEVRFYRARLELDRTWTRGALLHVHHGDLDAPLPQGTHDAAVE